MGAVEVVAWAKPMRAHTTASARHNLLGKHKSTRTTNVLVVAPTPTTYLDVVALVARDGTLHKQEVALHLWKCAI